MKNPMKSTLPMIVAVIVVALLVIGFYFARAAQASSSPTNVGPSASDRMAPGSREQGERSEQPGTAANDGDD